MPRMRGFVNADSQGVIRIERPRHVDEIRWTADGSEPTTESSLYGEPIRLPAPVTVRCRGFNDGRPVTFVATLALGS